MKVSDKKLTLTSITKKLIKFKNSDDQLEIFKRSTPVNSDLFFQELSKSISSISGFVHKNNAKEDIQNIFNDFLPSIIHNHIFFNTWLDDMSRICKIFCEFLNVNKLSFWIGNNRGCKRYHVDMVPFRLLVTYAGQGTELLPNYAADRKAFYEGKPNSKIIKDKSARKFINKWDIAIFRGGKKGILHRTPDSALKKGSSILLRLDDSSFLEDIMKINDVA